MLGSGAMTGRFSTLLSRREETLKKTGFDANEKDTYAASSNGKSRACGHNIEEHITSLGSEGVLPASKGCKSFPVVLDSFATVVDNNPFA